MPQVTPQDLSTPDAINASQATVTQILQKIESVILGKSAECKLALACILAKGHLLIEDLPGMGKTTLSHVLASSLGLSYQRTQFTNDLLPADVLGFSVFDKNTNRFELHKGPIFNQVILADEINRASPKTQSALLEAMAEKQVSIDGNTYDLPVPFFVIATQNPIFHAGTYPLPESQLDRFMMRLSLGFPDANAEKKILLTPSSPTDKSTDNEAIISQEQLIDMQELVSQIKVSDDVIDYIIALSQVSRAAYTSPQVTNTTSPNQPINDESVIVCKPLSPRASKALLQAAKAMAFIANRDYVLPDDVQSVFYVVCQHRLEMHPSQKLGVNDDPSSVANQIIKRVNVLNPFGHA